MTTALAPAPLTLAPDAPPTARARRMGFQPLRDLRCPHGHHLRQDAFFFDHGALRCKHREPLIGGSAAKSGGAPECGALLYLLACAGGFGAEGAPRLVFTAEVTHEELRDLERRRVSDPWDLLEYLGARFVPAGHSAR